MPGCLDVQLGDRRGRSAYITPRAPAPGTKARFAIPPRGFRRRAGAQRPDRVAWSLAGFAGVGGVDHTDSCACRDMLRRLGSARRFVHVAMVSNARLKKPTGCGSKSVRSAWGSSRGSRACDRLGMEQPSGGRARGDTNADGGGDGEGVSGELLAPGQPAVVAAGDVRRVRQLASIRRRAGGRVGRRARRGKRT